MWTKDKLFLVIGHRGSPASEIENTIESFNRAIREGANALEVDLSLTKDGVVVIWHDWDPNETVALLRESGFEPFIKYKPHPPAIGNEYRRKVSELTVDELRRHFDYKDRHSDNPSPARAYIPDLREFFEWSRDKTNLLCVFFDIKCPVNECSVSPVIMDKIKELILEYRPAFKIVLETAYPEVFRILRDHSENFEYCLDIEPPLGIILDPSEYSAVQAAIDNHNSFAIALRPRKITVANWTTYRRIIRYDLKLRKKFNRKNRGRRIEALICATVSKQSELRCLVRMGVNGIQTDFPERLAKIALKNKKILSPKPSEMEYLERLADVSKEFRRAE